MTQRPYLDVRVDAIPSELRTLGWVAWRAEQRGEGKATKVPYIATDPTRRASSTNSASWVMFDTAVNAFSEMKGRPDAPTGIGCVLTQEAGISCLDLDHVIDDGGTLDTRAATIIERCDSWTERSPSGHGVHVFVRGSVRRALRGHQVEVYGHARFICVTGHQWPGTPSTLSDQQAYLDHLVELDAATTPRARPWTGARMPPPDDLYGHLVNRLETLGMPVEGIRRWKTGYLAEIPCPWSGEHTTGDDRAAVMVHESGATDFVCLHAHCGGRRWADFRAVMETGRGH